MFRFRRGIVTRPESARPTALTTAALMASLCAMPAVATAQTCHTLTGHWTLHPQVSKMGTGLSFNPYYAVDTIALSLRQKDDSVAQEWVLTGPHLNETDRYTTPTDGRLADTATQSALNAVPLAVKGAWQNCTLIEQGRASLFGQQIWTTSTFVISPDDRTLTILQTSHSDLGDVERALVFDRTSERTAP